MNSVKSSLAKIVARTDYGPLRSIYRGIYLLGAHVIKLKLLKLPGIVAIYVCGSFARNQELHGASDIDLYVVVEKAYCKDQVFQSKLERIYKKTLRLFPFLGPLKERLSQVKYLNEDGFVEDPLLLFRKESNQLLPLYEKTSFSLAKPSNLPDSALPLGELAVQIVAVVNKLLVDADDLRFWKARLNVLRILLRQTLGTDDLLSQDQSVIKLLDTDSYHLYVRRNEKEQRRFFDIFWQGVSQIECHLQAAKSEVKIIPFEFVDDCDPSLCFNWTGNTPKDAIKIKAANLSYRQLKETLRAGFDPQKDFACIFADFVVWLDQSFCGTRLTSPWLFAPGGSTTVTFIKEYSDYHMRQIEAALAELKVALFEDIAIVGRKSGREFERYLQNDYRYISALISAYRLSCLTSAKFTVFSGPAAALRYLRRELLSQSNFLDLLIPYFDSLTDAKTSAPAVTIGLPSNFFGYLETFFHAVIGGQALPDPVDLHKRLSLSVCIITRNRPKLLSELLESLTKQTRLADEVVIVDNSDTAETKVEVDHYGQILPIRYLYSESHNIPALRNMAIAEATSEIVSFIDDDCRAEPEWLAHAERMFLRRENIGAVWGQVKPDFGNVSETIARLHNR